MQVSPDCRYLQTTASFELGDESFSCTGKTLIAEGYTGILTSQTMCQDEIVPNFTIDDLLPINEVSAPPLWKEKKGKLGANAMKRVAAGAHLPTLE